MHLSRLAMIADVRLTPLRHENKRATAVTTRAFLSRRSILLSVADARCHMPLAEASLPHDAMPFKMPGTH